MIFIFDIDDTLYDLEVPFRTAFLKVFKYEPDDLHEIFLDFRKYNNLVYEKAILGEITMEELCIYRAVSAFKDHNILIDDEKAEEFQLAYIKDKEHIELDPFVEMVLSMLKEKNIPIGIISNGPHVDQFEKIDFLKADRFIDVKNIFISEDVGAYKPDIKIFDFARKNIIKNTGLPCDSVVYFVGDAFDLDIKGAYNAGMNTIWVNRRDYDEDFSICKPDFVAYSFEELYNIVRNIIN